MFIADLADSGAKNETFRTLACLPAAPLALYSFSYLQKAVFAKLQPGFRLAVLEGLVAVSNWLREILNAYGLAQMLATSKVCAPSACLGSACTHRPALLPCICAAILSLLSDRSTGLLSAAC